MGRRPSDERGATAVLVAVMVSLVLLVSASFAIDLGQQRVVRRDVQAVADVVALDMVRLLDGSQAKQYAKASFDTAKDRSIDRNTTALGGKLKYSDVTWAFAKREAGAWVEVPKDSVDVPTAVRVVAKSSVGFAFGGVTGQSKGTATRSAVARNEESACFRIGSFIASLDTKQSVLLNPILSALLGSAVNLDLVSYKGLAGANVSLLDLVEVGGLGVGTVDELLTLKNVSVAKVFIAAADVLTDKGDLATANILRAISVGAGTPTIDIADLIHAAPGSTSALDASLNVLDLVTSSAFVANDDHAVAIPNLGINLPGVASTTTSLTVIEPPQEGCLNVDDGESHTAQVKLDMTAHINQQTLAVPALNTSLTIKPIDLAISIDLGQAAGKLLEVHCNAAGPDSIKVALSSSVVGGISISATAGATGTVDPVGGLLNNVLSLLGLGSLLKPPYLTLDASLAVGASSPAASSYNKTVTVPIPGGYTTPVGSGTGTVIGPVTATPKVSTNLVLHYWDGLLVLGSWKTLNITDPLNSVFTGVVNPLVSSLLTNVLNPLVATLQTALVEPLAKVLGLQVGGADVFAVKEPTCKGPKLVG